MENLLILIAPLLHSLEQVLTLKPQRIRWQWLDFETPFSALDGPHTARWLMVGAYVFYPPEVLSWGILGACGVLLWHWWVYNVGYHIIFDATPDRNIWQCLPGWKLLREVFPVLLLFMISCQPPPYEPPQYPPLYEYGIWEISGRMDGLKHQAKRILIVTQCLNTGGYRVYTFDDSTMIINLIRDEIEVPPPCRVDTLTLYRISPPPIDPE